ncbi:Self-incompatibility ribonuclease [Fasciolopsis buskii]|uniref:Self-incompatibility ribonuclease n=1 Tax=Fasciolopsis buskii TaxID=27845 RepID=A0A8E0S3N5_9TREM|nr:Self-incompatibility ribonuclease [Fasciolopsis buski]
MRLFTAAAVVLSMATICLAEIHWDYMIFSQQWAGTLCSFKEVRLIHCFSCLSKPVDKDFTIHGLWPTIWPAKQPTQCPKAPEFDELKLQPILPQLRRHWPDLLASSDPHKFWKHEWIKHGRCAIEDNIIVNEFGYFNASLHLKSKAPVLQ